MDAPEQQDGARTQPGQQAFIYYWVDYWEAKQKKLLPLFKLHQNSPVMERIQAGDIVWVFTRRRSDGHYVIVCRYLVARVGKDTGNDNTRYGQQFFESDGLGPSGLTCFDPDEQDDAEVVIGGLHLVANARPIGLSFEGANAVKTITI